MTLRKSVRSWLDTPTTRKAFVRPWAGVVFTVVLSIGLLSYQGQARAFDACQARNDAADQVERVFSVFIDTIATPEDKDALHELLDSAIQTESCEAPSFF